MTTPTPDALTADRMAQIRARLERGETEHTEGADLLYLLDALQSEQRRHALTQEALERAQADVERVLAGREKAAARGEAELAAARAEAAGLRATIAQAHEVLMTMPPQTDADGGRYVLMRSTGLLAGALAAPNAAHGTALLAAVEAAREFHTLWVLITHHANPSEKFRETLKDAARNLSETLRALDA